MKEETKMKKYLIVNSDDFGASTGINRGIIEAHQHGILTSTSFMTTGKATDEAVALARENPNLSIGLHFDVWGEDEREFDLGDTQAVRDEFRRQMDDFERMMGRLPTHVDSHRHAHRQPGMMPLFQDLVSPIGVPLRDNGQVKFVGGFYAQWEWLVTELDKVSPEFFIEMLRNEVEPGWTEISCHAGYASPDFQSVYMIEREAEVATLIDPRVAAAIDENGIILTNYEEYARIQSQPESLLQASPRKGFTLVELLVVITIIGLLASLLLPAIQQAREAARRMQCSSQLRQVAVALHSYENTFKAFPPHEGGTSGTIPDTNNGTLSGIVPLLPYFEQAALWDTIHSAPGQGGEPGSSTFPHPPGNIPVLLCPSSPVPPSAGVLNSKWGGPSRSYHLSLGDTNLNSYSIPPYLPPPARGAFSPVTGETTDIRTLMDGASNTIIMAEQALFLNINDLKGTFLEDFSVATPAECIANVGGTDYNGLGSILGNGRFWAQGSNIAGDTILTIIPPNGPSCGVFPTVSSRHTGGALVAMGDASIRFITNDIDSGDQSQAPPLTPDDPSPYGIWGALGTAKAGEVINDF